MKYAIFGFLAVLLFCAGGVCLAGDEGPDDAIAMVLEILKSDEQEMQSAAIAMAKDMEGAEVTKALAKELPNLPAASQVQLLSVFGDRGDKAALGAVIAASKSAEASVREAAYRALGQLGDSSTVMLLAERAAASKGDEQKAARESLYRLRGEGVDEAILGGIEKSGAKARVELVSSLRERNVVAGISTLLNTAKDSDRKVRIESFKVLGALGRPENLPAIVDLLVNVKSSSDRTEAEKVVATVAHKIEKKDQQAAAVLAKLASVKEVKARSSLLSALGRIGDNSALPALRKDEPLADLEKLAEGSKSQLHKILALRGFVRLLGLDSKRPGKETIGMYKKAMSLAPNAMEKRRVLSGLSGTASIDALDMAGGYLADKELLMEAEVAVVKIAGSILKEHPEQSAAMLKKVIANTKNETLRGQAREALKTLELKDK